MSKRVCLESGRCWLSHKVRVLLWMFSFNRSCLQQTIMTMIIKIICLAIVLPKYSTQSFDAFDDSIFFDVVWGDPKVDFKDGKTEIVMRTENSDEEYICQLPEPSVFQLPNHVDVDTSAFDIISKLDQDKVCSYRVDSYWIYEVCHGRHVKQFHEERDASNKKVLVKQAFFLGYVSYDSFPTNLGDKFQPPTLNHAGALRPYFSVVYKGGTECDLIPGYKRETTVYYLCMPDFQTSVVSVKEVATCRYDIVIYTSLLCKNKLYRIKEDPINHIYCLSTDGTKWKRPLGYNMLSEMTDDSLFKETPLPKKNPLPEPIIVSKSTKKVVTPHPKAQQNTQKAEPKKSQLTFPEKRFVRNFLTAEKCVIGGIGWWKYEFCYQKSLKQFHKERSGAKTEILLGIWDENRHIEYLNEKGKTLDTSKKPAYIDLHYFMGDICDETGLPRHVTLRMKCGQQDNNVQALTMFMEEPAMCVYKFTAESVLFCKVIENIDQFGVPRGSIDEIIDSI